MNHTKPFYKIAIFDTLFYSLLFAFGINLFTKSAYLFTGMVALFVVKTLVSTGKLRITGESILLLLCFTVYFIIYQFYFSVSASGLILFFAGPFLAYCTGYNFVKQEKQATLVVLILAVAMFAHGALNILLYFKRGLQGTRVVIDIWSNSIISATLQGAFFTMCVGLLFYGLVIQKTLFLKISIVTMACFSLYATMLTASRTLLYIMFACLLGNIALYIWLNGKSLIAFAKYMAIGILVLAVLFLIYRLDVFELRSTYQASSLYARMQMMDVTTDPRLSMYLYVIKNLFVNPFGGRSSGAPLYYAHNLWLDVAYSEGVIPFFLLIAYTILTIFSLLGVLKSKVVNPKFKYVIFSVYLSVYLNFMVEPILEGLPYLFISMCLINGITRKIRDTAADKIESVVSNLNH